MKLAIGLTGGIASGKSAAAARFELHGVDIFDADDFARDIVAPGSDALDEIVATFGPAAITAEGALDRPAMRRRIFADPTARRRLEDILHPRIRAAMQAACDASTAVYSIAAIPLLAEAGRAAYPWLSRILVIDAPEEDQLSRLVARDGIDAVLAARMLSAQATRAGRLAIADDVIVNDGSLLQLQANVDALHAVFLDRARALSSG